MKIETIMVSQVKKGDLISFFGRDEEPVEVEKDWSPEDPNYIYTVDNNAHNMEYEAMGDVAIQIHLED